MIGKDNVSYRLIVNELKDNQGFSGNSIVSVDKGNDVEEISLHIDGYPKFESEEECRKRLNIMTLKWIESNYS